MFMKESKTAAVCQIIQNEQIKSVYQPIISLTDGKVLGYEALARITRSEPDVSIEEMFVLAEQCGKLWELEYLCRKKAMAGIGKENYQIAIDDFGKACAGIQRVIDLHPQFVKIDMDLIRDIHKSPEKSRALRRMVKFCKPLGIQLIAEGIEEREELRADPAGDFVWPGLFDCKTSGSAAAHCSRDFAAYPVGAAYRRQRSRCTGVPGAKGFLYPAAEKRRLKGTQGKRKSKQDQKN